MGKFLCGLFGHNYPEYFGHGLDRGLHTAYPDGINRHHLSLSRKCQDCEHTERAAVHIPRVYVNALDKMSKNEEKP